MKAPCFDAGRFLNYFNESGNNFQSSAGAVVVGVLGNGIAGVAVDAEDSLSFPGHNGAVTRPAAVKVRAQDRHGEWFELEAEGLLARCIQHENDHLDGITIMESSEFFYEDTEEGRAAAAKKKEND